KLAGSFFAASLPLRVPSARSSSRRSPTRSLMTTRGDWQYAGDAIDFSGRKTRDKTIARKTALMRFGKSAGGQRKGEIQWLRKPTDVHEARAAYFSATMADGRPRST